MENSSCTKMRLSACGLGASLGVTSALAVLILGIVASSTHWAHAWVNVVSSIYVGFSATPKGIFIGIVWALVEGFVVGFIIAGIYNFVATHCPCKGCRSATGCCACSGKKPENLNKPML